ncbi:ABC transporter substrate-binding protein [Anaerocolumna aminovalerica]|jgi:raffinose/stachyose/melibiose transport system substrate-binding protein|uniref:ABC transporter substrate-binding protein n=1 Tax=Anaerocolumna aminovalerica TaxID=1527 RepID=UPI00248B19CD|nr:extracellular solute-binding protein [Anaerocolumna aminovalerica]
MKKVLKKVAGVLLIGVMAMGMLSGCGAKNKETGNKSNTGNTQVTDGVNESDKIIEINFPTSWVGVSSSTEWFNNRLKAFNEQYSDKYKVVVEEIAGDQAYVDKLKVLYSSKSLPDVISAGGYNLIDSMRDQLVDLTSFVDQEWKDSVSEVCWDVNSRDGNIYGIPYSRQVIGYFYNKDLFEKAGIKEPAKTWDEFFEQCDKLLAAGITPVSMDTADSGWLTSLLLGAMIASNDEGEKFMNTSLPKNYNTQEFIDAAGMIQKLFQKYTTQDAIGGKYENGASNFFMEQTAIIANGPWMVSDFYDTFMVEEGFADKIGTAMFPGDVMYNSGKIGFNIAAKSEEQLKASLEFVKFMTSADSQQKMLEMTGDIPADVNVTSDNIYPLINEVVENGNHAARNINDFQSLWYANVVDEISIQYPLLAQGQITPEEFATALTKTAEKN